TRPGGDVGGPVRVGGHRRHADFAGESRGEGVEARQQRGGDAVEHFDLRQTTCAGAGNDLGLCVAVYVPGADVHAAGKARGIGEEGRQPVTGLTAEHLDVRPAAGPRPGDDVGRANPLHVPGRDADATRETDVVRVEAAKEGAVGPAEHFHVRPAAGV